MYRYVNPFILIFFLAVTFWGCKKQEEANTKPNDTHIAAKFAKKHLTDAEFKGINWDYLREVKNGNKLAGWIVYPTMPDSDALSSYFIQITNGEPSEIVSYKIDSKKAVDAGSGVIQYDRKFFVSGKIKSESIELGAEKKVSANDVKGKEVSKLMSQCECCGTLPCVVVYAKRRVKALYIDMGVFDGNDANKIYVPIWDMGQSGGGASGCGGEDLPNINLADFIDWTLIGINLFTTEYYPGKEKNFPWKWWEVGSDASWENMDAAFSNQEKLLLELDAAK